MRSRNTKIWVKVRLHICYYDVAQTIHHLDHGITHIHGPLFLYQAYTTLSTHISFFTPHNAAKWKTPIISIFHLRKDLESKMCHRLTLNSTWYCPNQCLTCALPQPPVLICSVTLTRLCRSKVSIVFFFFPQISLSHLSLDPKPSTM